MVMKCVRVCECHMTTNETNKARRRKQKKRHKKRRENLGETLQREEVEILALDLFLLVLFLLLFLLHLLLLFSGAPLELHSNVSLSIPVTPGNIVP